MMILQLSVIFKRSPYFPVHLLPNQALLIATHSYIVVTCAREGGGVSLGSPDPIELIASYIGAPGAGTKLLAHRKR